MIKNDVAYDSEIFFFLTIKIAEFAHLTSISYSQHTKIRFAY